MEFAFWVGNDGQRTGFDLSRFLDPNPVGFWGHVSFQVLGPAQAVFRPFYLHQYDSFECQPLVNDQGRFLLVGSFRLDYRHSLGQALGLSLLESDSLSDSALVLKGWEKWQDRIVHHIHGDFAFVLYDLEEKVTWLITDRDVGRGLYYCNNRQGLHIASGLPIMRKFPCVSKELDKGYIASYLCDLSHEPGSTPFRDVKSVPWASIVRVDAHGQTKSWRYWDFDPDKTIRYKTDDDYVAAAREKLDAAHAAYLRVNGPLVSCLTGGWDCAAIIGTLRKLGGRDDLHAVTAIPHTDTPNTLGSSFNEGPRAIQTASHWPDVTHHLIEIENERHQALISAPEKTFLAAARPLRNVNNADWMGQLVQTTAQIGGCGLFTGARGNMGLTWDGRDTLTSAFARGRLDKALLEAWRWAKKDPYQGGFLRVFWREALKANLTKPMRDFCTQAMGFPAWPKIARTFFINKDLVKELDLVPRTLAQLESVLGAARTSGRERKILFFHAFNNSINQRIPHQPAKDGVMPLSPLGNMELLEFCFAIPDEQYFHKGESRWLAKRVLADCLPPESLTPQPRFSQGGNHFARMSHHRDFLQGEVERLASSPVVCSMMNVDKMRDVLNDWPTDEHDLHRQNGMRMLLGTHLPRAINLGQFIRWADGGNE